MTQRDNSLSIAKGIAFILMVPAQTILSRYLWKFINTFHMPIFFFASGYCFKKTNLIKRLSITPLKDATNIAKREYVGSVMQKRLKSNSFTVYNIFYIDMDIFFLKFGSKCFKFASRS